MNQNNEGGENMPPEIKEVVLAAQTALYDEEFDEVFERTVAETTGFAPAAATICAMLLQQAQDHIGVTLSQEELYAPEMASDFLMDSIYSMGQKMGIEEANDQESYNQALDIVEEQGASTEQQAQPQGAAAPVQPQERKMMSGGSYV